MISKVMPNFSINRPKAIVNKINILLIVMDEGGSFFILMGIKSTQKFEKFGLCPGLSTKIYVEC